MPFSQSVLQWPFTDNFMLFTKLYIVLSTYHKGQYMVDINGTDSCFKVFPLKSCLHGSDSSLYSAMQDQ